MRLKSWLSASAALFACLPVITVAHAEDAITGGAMDDVIITATRIEQPREAVSVSSTIITGIKLEEAQAVIVSDVLSRTAGISVTRNGGPGGATQLRIRGAETDQTLVLIDGVPLNDPSLIGGGYNFANMMVGDVDRIEVLRGPQSTLWGSQAIGGVVNILTRAPADATSGQASLEVGSRASTLGRAAMGMGGAWGGLRLAASHYATEGFSAFDKRLGGKEKDGYRNSSASGRLDLKLTDTVTVDLRGGISQARAEFDGYAPPTYDFGDTADYARTRDLNGYVGVRSVTMEGRFSNRIGLGYTQTDRENFDPAAAVTKTFDARGGNSRIDYQGALTLSPIWQAVFGASADRAWFRTASPSVYDPNPVPQSHAVRQDSAFGQIQARPLEGVILTVGVRHDQHQAFGGHTTFQTGATYALPDRLTLLRANYGEGFKAPSLYQLYGDYGDLGLSPELAKGWDMGIERSLAQGRIRASAIYFHRKTDNQIDFAACTGVQCTNRPYGLYANTARAIGQGLELTANASLTEALDLTANYTVMDTQNRSPGADFGKPLARRANRSGAAEATYRWPFKLTTSLAIQYVGDSFDDAANSDRLKSYVLADVRATYPISDRIEVYGRIENLTDRQYAVIRGYGSTGRGAFVGIRARF